MWSGADVGAVVHVAEDADLAGVEHFAQCGDDALDAWMIRGDAIANQPVRRRQVLEQVDRHVELPLVLEQDVGGVDAGRSGTYDREAQLGQDGSFAGAGVTCGCRGTGIRGRSSLPVGEGALL
jgi:hypothetical protein